MEQLERLNQPASSTITRRFSISTVTKSLSSILKLALMSIIAVLVLMTTIRSLFIQTNVAPKENEQDLNKLSTILNAMETEIQLIPRTNTDIEKCNNTKA